MSTTQVRVIDIIPARYNVEINYTAEDWELFTEMQGVDRVAKRINAELVSLAAEGLSREEFLMRGEEVLGTYSDYGAADSEPAYHLCKITQAIYGG